MTRMMTRMRFFGNLHIGQTFLCTDGPVMGLGRFTKISPDSATVDVGGVVQLFYLASDTVVAEPDLVTLARRACETYVARLFPEKHGAELQLLVSMMYAQDTWAKSQLQQAAYALLDADEEEDPCTTT